MIRNIYSSIAIFQTFKKIPSGPVFVYNILFIYVQEFKKNGLTGLNNLICRQKVVDKYLYNDGNGRTITTEEYKQWKREKTNLSQVRKPKDGSRGRIGG